MARAVDIPSRIVVGFHEGALLDGRDDLWSVRGSDATAWVELFVDGRWQAFFPAADRPEATPPTVISSFDTPALDEGITNE